MVEIKGEINQEVINTLIDLTKAIVGEKATDNIMRSVMKKNKENVTGKDIVFTFADEIQNLFGQHGGYAIIRQLGREVAKSLMKKYPKEEWEDLLEKFLNAFGFVHKIERNSNEAYIYNCVFYEENLKPRGLKPTEHCVCWYAWGFIEAFIRELEIGVKGIKWEERDYENKRCKFVFLR
jgi:predicted hydrocarbon binding protein